MLHFDQRARDTQRNEIGYPPPASLMTQRDVSLLNEFLFASVLVFGGRNAARKTSLDDMRHRATARPAAPAHADAG